MLNREGFMDKTFDTRVIDTIQRTHDIKSFRFSCPQDISFKPGQFFFVTIRIHGKEASKHFSFSNSPTEHGYIEFTKRLTGSEFSQALDTLKTGDWARIRMPFGLFTFEGEYPKIACLSSGIGITPVRSICKNACDRHLPTDIVLLYGNRTEKDIAFLDDFRHMAKENRNFRVIYTLSRPLDADSWSGKQGRISGDIIREEIPDYLERIFYICGPPQMVNDLKEVLTKELMVDTQKIKTELFTGYGS